MIDQRLSPNLVRTIPGLLPWQSYFLAFALGIFSFKHATPAGVAFITLVVADTCIRGWTSRLPVLVFVFCAVFGFGYASQRAPEPVETPAWMESRQSVILHGVVDRVEPRVGGRLRVVLRSLTYKRGGAETVLPGKLAWTWRSSDHAPSPGQDMSARMRVVPVRSFGNPGGWDFQWYWQRQGVFWRGWLAGRDVRITWGDQPDGTFWSLESRLRSSVAEHLPQTQGGAMVLALVTGNRSRLDMATSEATRSAGLAHTLALSGLHVGFVAAMGLGLAWFFSWIYPPILLAVPRPKLAVLLAAPLVLGYAWLGQPSQSLIRAATMFGFWGFLLLQGRGRVLMDGLFFALAVIIFITPFAVFDLSLQMSALAVAGIGVMYPGLRSLLCHGQRWWTKPLLWVGGLLAVSLCANIALLPLVSRIFGTWSPNFLLNLVWIPILGLAVMPLGLLGMMLSVMSWAAPLGAYCLLMAARLMDWLLVLLHITGETGVTPVFSVLRPLWPELIGGGLLLVLAVLVWMNRRACVGLAGLGFVLLVWPHVSVMAVDAQDVVRLTLIDVGQGQAAVIATPGGHRWLIDGGAGSKSFDFGESVVAPALTAGRPPRLDGVFMSHPDADHSHGLPFILSRFDVGGYYTNGMKPRGRTGKRMHTVLMDKAMLPEVLHAGQRLRLGQDTFLEVLHPASGFTNSHGNERSLVLRLVRKGRPLALIPGDIEKYGIAALLASSHDLSAEILVLPHHGSRTGHVPELYRAVLPEAALCSNGYLNRYGFPHAEVVHGVGVPVFSTSGHGQVTALWDFDNELSIRAFWP